MSNSCDYTAPVNTTATVTVEVWDLDGEAIDECLTFRVDAEGYPECDAADIDIGQVECLECGCKPETRRKPGEHEGAVLVRLFERIMANDGHRYDGERDEIVEQLQAALAGGAYEVTGACNPYSRNFEG